MVSPFFLFFAVAIPLGIGWLVRHFSDDSEKLRALDEAPETSIAAVQQGDFVKITGRIRPVGPLLSAPFTGRECVFFEMSVTQQNDVAINGWKSILRLTEAEEFLVEDESGRALVKIGNVKAMRVADVEREATPEFQEWLSDRGFSSYGDTDDYRRYREAIFEPGERVSVVGIAAWEQDPDPEGTRGYREARRRLVLSAPADGPLLVVGHAPDTRGVPEAWPSARS